MPVGNGAEFFTFEGLEDKLLQMLLGNTVFGGFTPVIKKLVNENILGSTSDALLDSVLYTNMTPYGVFAEQQSAMQRRMANKQIADMTRASRAQWIEATAKTMLSYEDWERKNQGGTLEEYNAFMHNRAEGFADSTALNWILNTVGFDPDNIAMARNFLGKAGSNMVRLRQAAGDRDAMVASRAMHRLFLNEDNQIDYNKAEYGFMTMGETSAVVAALTRDMDFFNTPDVANLGSNVEKIKQATKNIREAAKEYTNALSPLKDVFGADIPQMIQKLEEMTGQRLTQMDPTSVAEASRRIMAGSEAGRYQLQQLATVRQQISGALTQMDVPFINDIAATEQAQTVLGITNTGLIPSSMSAHRYEQMAADRVMRTSNSRGASALNQAYALWRERHFAANFQNDQEAFDLFQQEYNQRRQQGMTVDAAIMDMADVANLYSLEQRAYTSRFYQDAVRHNFGGRLALEEYTRDRISAASLSAYMNGVGGNFDAAVAAIQDNIGIMNEQKLLDSDLSEDVKGQVRAIRDGLYGDLGATLSQVQAARDTEARTRRLTNVRASMEALNVDLATNATDLIGRFIGVRRGTRGGIPTLDTIRGLLGEANVLQSALPEVKDAAAAMVQATGHILDFRGITEEDRAQVVMQDWLSYLAKDGMQNAHFKDALNRYTEAAERGDEAAMANLAPQLYVARYANEDLFDQYANTAERAQDVYARVKAGEIDVDEVNDYLKAGILQDKLKDIALKSGDAELLAAITDRGKGNLSDRLFFAAGQEGDITSNEFRNVIESTSLGKLFLERHENETLDAINTVANKSDSTTKGGTDLYGMLDKLDSTLSELTDVMGKVKEEIEKKKPQDGNAPAAPAPGTQPGGN